MKRILRFFLIKISIVSICCVAAIGSVCQANNGEAILLGRFKYWSVYRAPKGTIFMTSKAEKQSGTYKKREDPHLIISCFGNNPELSVYTGYEHKKGSEVHAVISMSNKDPNKIERFTMLTQGERAWVRKDGDIAIINKLKLGAKVTLKAESYKGTNSIDEYSLEGFQDAYNLMICKKK